MKDITRVVVKLLLKNLPPIIKSYFTTSNINPKQEVYNVKSTNNNTEIALKIVQRSGPVNRMMLRCNHFLNEKLEITKHQGINLLNKRSELVSKCTHFNKLLLMNFENNINWWQATDVPFDSP